MPKQKIGPARITDYEDVKRFLTAGRAVFTLLDTRTQLRSTYEVRANEKSDLFFVRVRTGEHTQYIGYMTPELQFKMTEKSRLPREDARVLYFIAFALRMRQKAMPEFIHFYHEGICAKCGSALTVPESINNGFGPVCLKRIMDITRPMKKVLSLTLL